MRDDAALLQVRGATLLQHPNGLHARPAIKLTKLAKRFTSSIAIAVCADGPWVDAKSVAKVLGMKIPSDVMLYFTAAGSDADAAVDALIALVARDFADGDSG